MDNPRSDGNCGYWALRYGLGRYDDDKNGAFYIRRSLFNHLEKCEAFYKRIDWFEYDETWNRLLGGSSKIPRSGWFKAPECAQLAADVLHTPIALFSSTQEDDATLYLPLLYRSGKDVVGYFSQRPIILVFVGDNHFVNIDYKTDHSGMIKWPSTAFAKKLFKKLKIKPWFSGNNWYPPRGSIFDVVVHSSEASGEEDVEEYVFDPMKNAKWIHPFPQLMGTEN